MYEVLVSAASEVTGRWLTPALDVKQSFKATAGGGGSGDTLYIAA